MIEDKLLIQKTHLQQYNMDSFKESFLITEKISKKEISAALNDPNIQIGFEFEFIMPFFLQFEKEFIEADSLYGEYNDNFIRYIERKTDSFQSKIPQKVKNFYKKIIGKDVTDFTKEEADYYRNLNIPYYEMNLTKLYRKHNIYRIPRAHFEDGAHIHLFPHWNDLPFTDYRFAKKYEYGLNKSTTFWRIEKEAGFTLDDIVKKRTSKYALPTNAIEIVSPILSVKEALYYLPKILEFINKYGTTQWNTGLHVNMSYKGKSLETDIDKLKLMLFVDEGWVWKKFKDRIGYHEIQSIKELMFKCNKDICNTNDVYNYIDIKDFGSFIKQVSSKIEVPVDKGAGINLEDKNRIEFRYLGGKNYHKRKKILMTGIGKFAAILKLSLDPTEKQKEYRKKIERLIKTLEEK